jgi:hypothetical protein
MTPWDLPPNLHQSDTAVLTIGRGEHHASLSPKEATAMHDYTAWQVHEDRMRDLTREADAFRLAAIAKEGKPRRGPRALLRWVRGGLSLISSAASHSRPDAKAAGPDSGAAAALSVSSGSDR